MYSVAHTEQLRIFAASLGAGFLLGMLYDIFRAIRLALSDSKICVAVFDVMYFLVFGFASYLFMLAANKGEIRSYIIFGELLGAVFCYVSLAPVSVKLTYKLSSLLKKLFTVLLKPFKALKRLVISVLRKFKTNSVKSSKKSEKMRKKLLPKARLYVYNLWCILKGKNGVSQKGGSRFGSKKEKQ